LADSLREINGQRGDEECDIPSKPTEGKFWSETKVVDVDLATLYESKIKRLFNIYCRQIFWSIVQKDKIEFLFDFLLTNE
jgi:hypothetical protein